MSKKTYLFAAAMLMVLTACKNSANTAAEIIDLPRAETPDSVAAAMDTFFQEAANDSNAVIAITSNVEDLQGELNLVWNNILPVL